MRKIVVVAMVSMDGVMEAPNADPLSDFEFEGWSDPIWDDTASEVMSRELAQPFDLLLGRKTYDLFASYWPNEKNEVADAFNRATKYVTTRGDVEPSWDKTIVVTGDVAENLRQIKAGDGPMIQVIGSCDLVQTLLEHDLVDEVWARIFPVTLGKGQRLFGDGARPGTWKVTESVVSPSSIILATYVRNGELKTGTN